MKSIIDVYKVGAGPSSSHTMGPENACKKFIEKYPEVKEIKATLYGSLALTGKGHLTDWIIEKTCNERNVSVEISWKPDESVGHENSMTLECINCDTPIKWLIHSIGGGDIRIVDQDDEQDEEDVYPHNNMKEIIHYCETNDLTFVDYISKYDKEAMNHMKIVWEVMSQAIENGLSKDGILPGDLKVARRAKKLFEIAEEDTLLSAYAYAVNEENSSGGTIVTAPTCGACGVIPAVLRYYKEKCNLSDEKLCEGLAVAGLFGAVVKKNASVSGAEAGCQAEVGTATAMAAAAIAWITDSTLRQIVASAEIGLEHQLGLTCDPVLGYVQIPCIQRNAVGASKARTAYNIALGVTDDEKVSFDTVVKVMYETGKDMKSEYRETALGGLAKYFTAEDKR